VLAILVQSRRDKRAAVTFLRRLLEGLAYVPRVVITDKVASYGAAMREVLRSVEHRRRIGLNNRAETSHQPTRERERRRCFKSPGPRPALPRRLRPDRLALPRRTALDCGTFRCGRCCGVFNERTGTGFNHPGWVPSAANGAHASIGINGRAAPDRSSRMETGGARSVTPPPARATRGIREVGHRDRERRRPLRYACPCVPGARSRSPPP